MAGQPVLPGLEEGAVPKSRNGAAKFLGSVMLSSLQARVGPYWVGCGVTGKDGCLVEFASLCSCDSLLNFGSHECYKDVHHNKEADILLGFWRASWTIKAELED